MDTINGTYDFTNVMSFVPRYPWNDDERDTSSYIQYYSQCHEAEEVEEYIPTYRIMKEYYQEQQREMLCYQDDYDNDEDWFSFAHAPIDWFDDDGLSLSSNELIDPCSIDNGDVPTNSEDEEDNASSPYVSSKFWYM
jgi:hypothetical protein